MESKRSFFMVDSSSSDKKEIVVDYFLSWTLRCASDGGLEYYNNERLVCYCRRILSVLLFDNPSKIKEYRIKSVKTWKQWKQIDLCAEIILENKSGEEEKYALLMENKVYTRLHGNQLERYKEIFEAEYHDSKFNLRYVYFTCHDDFGDDKVSCNENGFQAYTMDDVYNKASEYEEFELTGNALFDEFWLSSWG